MKVEIYSKADCGLCDELKETVEAVRRKIPFDLVEVDITKDPLLFERYRYDVPVVFIDGQKAFKHRLTAPAFEARLRKGTGTEVA